MKCPHCGQSLGERLCPSCGWAILEESVFCHRCGSRLECLTPDSPSAEEESGDFSKRILCSDGTCIGVIDEKGICKVCGKPYAGEAE